MQLLTLQLRRMALGNTCKNGYAITAEKQGTPKAFVGIALHVYLSVPREISIINLINLLFLVSYV